MNAKKGSTPAAKPGPAGISIYQTEGFLRALRNASVRRLCEGESIIVQGRTSKAAFFLCEGEVEVFAETAYGPVRLASLSAPRLIGEVGVLASLPRTASIRAASNVILYRIGRDDLIALGKAEPELLLSVIGELGRQLEGFNRTISLYMNALAALERAEFDPRILDDLNNPPPQTAAFTEAFRRFASQIVGKRRQEDEMASAAAIQRSLLPDPAALSPISDIVDVHATMRPAREVGGDFYDFFLLDPKRLVIAVGDVCGKGLPASLFAAITVTVLRTTIREEADLEKAITRANSILCRDNAASLFATLFIGVLDLESGRLDYCNCGHNAPMIVSANAVRTLPATGLPLALMEDHAPAMRQTTLSSAEALVVYSDGITEALNAAGQEFGEDRLAETAQSLHNDATRAAVDRIVEAVDSFAAGCEQSDDITCAVIKWRDPARIG